MEVHSLIPEDPGDSLGLKKKKKKLPKANVRNLDLVLESPT